MADQRARFDVVGLGNAIVDVIGEADEALLAELDLDKGMMTLLDEPRMHALYARMGPAVEASGGSCANTMAGLASLGGRAAYVGKVASDQLGEIFGHDIRSAGVAFSTRPLSDGPPTARCLVFVTPDAQRTMGTYLGACVELGPKDVDHALIRDAAITYLEGYLWDRPDAKAACLRAAEIAHANGREIALTLSDPFCVDRWRDEFVSLIEAHVDILIANEAEITSLFQTDDFETALGEARRRCRLVAATRGPHGSTVASADEAHVVPAAPVPHVLDTTGAGDLFAAGLLYGLTHGLPLPACGRLGSATAGAILGQFGARSEHALAPLIETAAA
jgi:sugar/nucleoside kinase (ribokinase family)